MPATTTMRSARCAPRQWTPPTTSRKFTGKEYESDVKLYYFAARYYDPHIGRFTQRDPAGDGINWYIYTHNNPLGFIDPTGMRALSKLESYAINLVFKGSVSPDELDITMKDLAGDRGQHLGFRDGKYRIEIDPKFYAGLTGTSTLSDAFDNKGSLRSDVTEALGILIHEATHSWQRKNNSFFFTKSPLRPPLPDDKDRHYGFNTRELITLQLGNEQHASAVQSYFHVAWQLSWGRTTVDLSMDKRFSGFGQNMAAAQAPSMLSWFRNLMTQIRTVPVTWGGIKNQ